MKGKELLETYPKIANIIREWFTNKMLESLSKADDVPENFRNAMREKGVTDDALITIIDKSPAMLFEIFDSLHVYIGIVVYQSPDTEKVAFNYFICPNGECLDPPLQEFLTRKDVEYYAMLAAIQYIDNNFDEISL